jgi:glc operon protein GlcG
MTSQVKIFSTFILAGLVSLAMKAQAQTANYGAPLTLKTARTVMAAGIAEAQKLNLTVAIAVLDSAGHLVAFERMDDTQLGSVAVAQDKAMTAVLFRRPTKVFEQSLSGAADAGQWLPALTLRNVTAVEGGVPLVAEGKVVGSVGVSGGKASQDGLVAQAAAAALATSK